MAIGYKLYDDSGLTIISNTTVLVDALSDLSDGAHDYTYYLGNVDSNKALYASSNPGVDDIVLTPTYILPEWQSTHGYSLGASVIPTSANGYRYEVTTAGTSAGSEPTWGVILNGTTTDGSVVWTLVAEDSPITEIILALSSGELDTNTPGASLALGNTILSGVINAVPIYLRVTNTITAVSDSVSTPELGLVLNSVVQRSL